MKKVSSLVLIFSIVLFVAKASLFASEHGDANPLEKGVLLTAFGTSHPDPLAARENLKGKNEIAFPQIHAVSEKRSFTAPERTGRFQDARNTSWKFWRYGERRK